MDFKLPPELDALKLTIRQIVKNECIPLENSFLTTSPKRGYRPNLERRGA